MILNANRATTITVCFVVTGIFICVYEMETTTFNSFKRQSYLHVPDIARKTRGFRSSFQNINITGKAYQYPDVVGFRIIVMSFDRAYSLLKCLNSLQVRLSRIRCHILHLKRCALITVSFNT